ncbi:hypothetical protein RJ639_026071 [Escallonia herrerae]|uniref:DELLA protein n=1 Tax=Escallonia herrerae TaxID=1293975 RepID=A0AA88UXN6_9ASTE|nr:hypothetical protein RJ639_026071 [Escallonia herrerae]
MKRDHPHPLPLPHQNRPDTFSSGGSSSVGGGGVGYSGGKSKMWEQTEQDAGDDELLAVLGYKVRASDMAEVAQKLEHLEEAMGHAQEDGLSHLGSDTVHSNPSDLSSWLESMISELNPPTFDSSNPLEDPFTESSTITTLDNSQSYPSFDSELKVIPGKAVYPQIQQQPPVKRMKPTSESSSSATIWGFSNESTRSTEPTRPVVLFDSQENGVRLVHTLMASAEAVQQGNLKLAEALVKQIGFLAVSQVGAMRKLADTIHVEFEYRGFVANSLADLDASMLDLREGEVVAVNSVFELHPLLARPGAIEKVLSAVKEMKPEILTVVEQESNHNGPVFLDRFTESLHYYSTLFDSLEDSGGGGGGGDGGSTVSSQDKVMSEVYLGRQICNLVACEGVDRVERHETLSQWRARLDSAGFGSVHLGSNAFKQASMLLALFAGGDGYRVEEHDGCLMLGWHSRPLITTSAWKLS